MCWCEMLCVWCDGCGMIIVCVLCVFVCVCVKVWKIKRYIVWVMMLEYVGMCGVGDVVCGVVDVDVVVEIVDVVMCVYCVMCVRERW